MKKFCQAAALVLASVLAMPVLADNGQDTTSVPLQVVPMGQNNYKVSVTISVAGGPPSPVTFDTGGVGLHIFASQVGTQNIRYTKQKVTSSFGDSQSGFSFVGVIAYAPVTIGGVTTKPIPILVIQSVKCRGNGTCAINMNNNGTPPMFGQFYGEMGVGMLQEQDPTPIKLSSPLRQLPGNYGSGFIIKNLSPGGTGQLILGLNSQNSSGFNTVQLPQAGQLSDNAGTMYDDKSLQVQYQIGNVSKDLRTTFDTGGDFQVNLYSPKIPGLAMQKKIVKPGLEFDASLPNSFDWNFTTTNRNGPHIIALIPPAKSKGTYVNTGIGFFFDFNMMYDFKDGMLGFQQQD